jgi:hypothetical protein
MASTLHVADYLCQQNGIGYCDAPFQGKVAFEECLRTLHLQPQALDLMVNDVEQDIQRMEDQGLLPREQV